MGIMGTYEFKGMVLRFDSEKEADIINFLEELASRHKLGEYLASLVRISTSDEKIRPDNFEEIRLHVYRNGYDRKRKVFFDKVETQLREMKKKIDEIYERAMYVYALEVAGKYLGVKDRAKQILLAQKVLEEQFKMLCMTLGVSTLRFNFKADKDEVDIKVEKFLEGLLDRYGELLVKGEEEREHVDDEYRVVRQPVKVVDRVVGDEVVKSEGHHMEYRETIDKQQIQTIKNSDNSVPNEPIVTEENAEEDKVIDFGDTADWDLLSRFVNQG